MTPARMLEHLLDAAPRRYAMTIITADEAVLSPGAVSGHTVSKSLKAYASMGRAPPGAPFAKSEPSNQAVFLRARTAALGLRELAIAASTFRFDCGGTPLCHSYNVVPSAFSIPNMAIATSLSRKEMCHDISRHNTDWAYHLGSTRER